MKVIKLIILFALTTQVLSNDGIWTGIFDINGHGKYDFTILISDQMATAYTEKAKVVYKGKITTYKNKFKWNLSMYLKDGNKFGTAEITGKIIDGNIMSGKWVTEPAKDYGNIYLIKDLDKSKEIPSQAEDDTGWEIVSFYQNRPLQPFAIQ